MILYVITFSAGCLAGAMAVTAAKALLIPLVGLALAAAGFFYLRKKRTTA